jgi:hypothetical protein
LRGITTRKEKPPMRNPTAALCGSLLLAAASNVSAGVDAKLLDMLLANGSITKAQHTELMGDLAKEQRVEKRSDKEKLDKDEFVAFQQLAGWAAGTKLTGDMRVRNDYINVDDRLKNSGSDQDRQRIRARIGAITQVNPQVEMGIQIASGSSADRRSTNQTMIDYFDRKPIWLDLGYVDYHPVQVPGLKLFGGKMKQPWIAIADVAWDGDINPEGFAAQYVRKFGTNTLTSSASYMILKDNVDSDGVEWEHDLSLLEGQIAYAFDIGDMRLTLGGTVNEFGNETQLFGGPAVALRGNGNTTDTFQLWEAFSQLDVIGLPVPLSLYGQYIENAEARDLTVRDAAGNITAGPFEDGGEDTAWLFGVRTNIGGIAFDYNYRDVERNAVVGTLTDSDFAAGFTGSSGHKLKAQYDILKNFNVTLTWFETESDVASHTSNLLSHDKSDVRTIMLDLNAKY